MRAASVGAISGMLKAWEKSAMAMVPLASAVTAVISGSVMPRSEPKAMRMMSPAATSPMSELKAGGLRLTSAIALPPISTCSPDALAPCARFMTFLMSPGGRLAASPLKSTVARAVLPSRLTMEPSAAFCCAVAAAMAVLSFAAAASMAA